MRNKEYYYYTVSIIFRCKREIKYQIQCLETGTNSTRLWYIFGSVKLEPFGILFIILSTIVLLIKFDWDTTLSSKTLSSNALSSKEHWSNGTLVEWIISRMEHWSNGTLVERNTGRTEHSSNGAFV